MTAGVSLTFDVDAETGLACRPGSFAGRLSSLSEARFGLVRGVPRVLEVLREAGLRATFYVPGLVAERDGSAIREIAAAGHEIAHHGYAHLPSHTLDDAAQRAEVERGVAALQDCVGARVRGYRSPAWELTPATLALLVEHAFRWDSSLMADDRPYELAPDGSPAPGGSAAPLVELPVHWSLDDVPYFREPLAGGSELLQVWRAEHDAAAREDRHVTFTMHPEVIGRAHRLDLLRALIEHLGVPVRTHGDVAASA